MVYRENGSSPLSAVENLVSYLRYIRRLPVSYFVNNNKAYLKYINHGYKIKIMKIDEYNYIAFVDF